MQEQNVLKEKNINSESRRVKNQRKGEDPTSEEEVLKLLSKSDSVVTETVNEEKSIVVNFKCKPENKGFSAGYIDTIHASF